MRKNSPRSALEALQGRFGDVFDIGIVLQYNLADFFDFCRYLGYFGYRPRGFNGRLQAPAEFIEHHLGNCWDQTELQREWFQRHGYDFKTYLLYYYLSDDSCPSHSILVYRENGKWFWFEPMFYGASEDYIGIHDYASESELLDDFGAKFLDYGQQTGLLPHKIDKGKRSLYEYLRPKYGINDAEFYDFCRMGRKIW